MAGARTSVVEGPGVVVRAQLMNCSKTYNTALIALFEGGDRGKNILNCLVALNTANYNP